MKNFKERKAKPKKKPKSELEAIMLGQLESAGLAEGMVREHRFHPDRRWRFDFCWPSRRLALEVQGGVWVNGGHNRGAGFTNDCEKFNEAALLGWRLIKVSGGQVRNGCALGWVERALEEFG